MSRPSTETRAASSEIHSEGELHLALDGSEGERSDLTSTRASIHTRIWICKVNLVEDVEGVGTKLRHDALRDGEDIAEGNF